MWETNKQRKKQRHRLETINGNRFRYCGSISRGFLEYVNNYGIQKFNVRCLELADNYGKQFIPPKLLSQMAKANTTFN